MAKTNKKTKTAISVNNLLVQFGSEIILRNISFSIEKGSIVAIIGPNGSGKSTLVRTILGLQKTNSGEVTIFNKEPAMAMKRVGYVPQRFQFDPDFPLTVHEFLQIGSQKKLSQKQIKHILNDVGLKSTIKNHQLGQLSGGELQRVIIAHAIVNYPDILFLDEPSSGIDIAGEQSIIDVVKNLNKKHGTTIIMVSHEIDLISSFVSQVICLNRALICHGTPKESLTEATLKKLFGEDVGIYEHEKPHRHAMHHN